ncbi:acylphosphatase [Stieleria varia]|uniref:acylphosphatase n=1 Tax=Stieleria varia TaxID=2528005 RepID=A0A5C6B2L2_9BACT|nr:acylphosphatase [Stieleria varia]TWU05476.1 Acylphosphatase [Stieleria varia]
MTSDKRRFIVRFTGHVQGVGFRATAVGHARGLGVHGFVRNEPDGSVLLDADGPPGDLRELVRRIKTTMGDRIDFADVQQAEPLGREGGLVIRW